MAVLTGYIVDALITSLLYTLLLPQSPTVSDPTQSGNLVLITLLLLSTGVGGYVAGRMAQTQRALHGLLVGVVGILVQQLLLLVDSSAPGLSRTLVLGLAAGCVLGALGGWLSRYPPQGQRGR